MATKPLPLIPRKHITAHGSVALWDIIGSPTGEKDPKTGADITDGPVLCEFTGILAREALMRDPARFKLDLPKGMKPGPAQIEAEQRAREAEAEAEAEPPDPVFGRRSQQ